MASTKPWADGPFKLIPGSVSGDSKEAPVTGARRLAAEMTAVHNTILRGANAIYLQAVNVAERGTTKDKLDFANFAFQWTAMVDEHHSLEEDPIFPEINRLTGVSGLMDENVEEHKIFHAGFGALEEYLNKVKSEEVQLDGHKVRSIMDDFMPALESHLTNEIPTLIKLDAYADKVDWPKWFAETTGKVMQEYTKDTAYKQRMVPMVFILHDKDFEGGVWEHFPGLPWFVVMFLKWWYMGVHKDWWRFAPNDLSSKRQELPFA